MEMMKKLNFAKILGWIFLLILVGSSIFVGANFRQIQDYFKAKNFKPSAEILQIVEKIKPTESGKQIFYATNPQLLLAENFNQNCGNYFEQTTVLGCYRDDSIFVFSVENEDLNGVEEVTAAHELLHAVWARMSESERKDIGAKLQAEYERVKTSELEDLMASYAKTEPGQETNELHSILGTEIADLSGDLEQYYAKIFENRQEIVEMNKKYRSKFKELEQNAENLSQEIKKLEAEISAEKDDYSAKTDLLNADIETFNANAKNGFYSSEAVFQRDRQSLLARVNFLAEYRAQINSKIENYESKIAELKQISTKIQRLYNSINSKIEKVEQATSL
ncbi:MAG: hypothetical protein WAV68_02440 [Candidatus Nanogingivalis sp.]